MTAMDMIEVHLRKMMLYIFLGCYMNTIGDLRNSKKSTCILNITRWVLLFTSFSVSFFKIA